MAAVTGTLGGQPIVLDNAATDDTLKQILAALRGQGRPAGGAAGGGAGAAGPKNFGALGKDAEGASTAMKALNKVAGKAGDQFSSLATSKMPLYAKALMATIETVGVLAGAFTKLTKQAYSGDVAVSDFFGALEGVPIIGKVFGLFADLAKIQEENMRAFRTMAKSGVGFEGALTTIRTSALALGMTVDQFAATMKNNTDVFRILGGDVETGAKQFVKFGAALRDSQAGANLRALGMTAEDSANTMANFIRNNGGLTDRQKKDYAGVAESVANYAKQTDRLAKLTGTSAEEIEKKMAKEAQDEAWQATLQGMDEKDRESANEALKVAMATGGQGAVDALKAKMMGLPPMTEAGQKFVTMSGNAAKRMDEMQKVLGSNMTKEQKRQKLEELGAMMQLDRAKDAEAIGIQTLQAMAAQGDQNAIAMLKASNDMKKAGVTTYEGAVANLKKATDSQNAQLKSQASAMAEAEKGLKDLGKVMDAFIAPLLNVLTPLMTNIITSFTNFVSGPGMTALLNFGVKMEGMIKAVAEYVGFIFSKEGAMKIINSMGAFFSGLWIDIKRGIAASFGETIGNAIYSEADAKKDKDALKERQKIEDDRLTAVGVLRRREEEFEMAKLAMNDKAMQAQRASIDKKQAEMKELNAVDNKNMTALQQMQLQQKKDVLAKEIDADKANLAKAEEMRKSGAAAKLDAERKGLEAKAGENSKGERVAPDSAEVKKHFNAGTAGSGEVVQNFGNSTNVKLHGEEAVLNKEQLKNLVTNAKGGGGGQEALLGALQTLNMNTEKLIALSAEQVRQQTALVNKIQWTGNLFE
jgi:hypothetical protein